MTGMNQIDGGGLPSDGGSPDGECGLGRKSPSRPLTTNPAPNPTKAPNGPKKTAQTTMRVSLALNGAGVPAATGTSARGGIGSGCVWWL